MTFSLQPRAQGTRAEVTVRGYGLDDDGIAVSLDRACGWGEALTLLKFYLEHRVIFGPVP